MSDPRRDQFAAQILCAFIVEGQQPEQFQEVTEDGRVMRSGLTDLADIAVAYADALIDALDRPPRARFTPRGEGNE